MTTTTTTKDADVLTDVAQRVDTTLFDLVRSLPEPRGDLRYLINNLVATLEDVRCWMRAAGLARSDGRTFAQHDLVGLWGGAKHIDYDGDDTGEIVGYANACHPDAGEAEGTGPLYIVNVGNVFGAEYQHVFAQSELVFLDSFAPDHRIRQLRRSLHCGWVGDAPHGVDHDLPTHAACVPADAPAI